MVPAGQLDKWVCAKKRGLLNIFAICNDFFKILSNFRTLSTPKTYQILAISTIPKPQKSFFQIFGFTINKYILVFSLECR